MRIKRKSSGRTCCSCATSSTAKANQTWYSILNFEDEREKECALRGLIESPEKLVIKRDDGEVLHGILGILILSRIKKRLIR